MKTEFKIFLDTNILVYSTLQDFDNEKNLKVLSTLSHFFKENNELFISTQILREFYAVVTNSKFLKKPLSSLQANNQIDVFINTFNVLPVTVDIFKHLKNLTTKHNITGQKIHDTAIVATMIEFDIKNIYTYKIKDFKIFKEINVLQ
jgi:predicted nucleic acid-binding protein